MDYCSSQQHQQQRQRRHNPVDSICRKLQTIQRRDCTANSPFQIPKLCSNSYDSPQGTQRHNLENILKKRAVVRGEGGEGDRERDRRRGSAMLTPPGSPNLHRNLNHPSTPSLASIPSVPSTPRTNPPTPANATFTITSTLGEQRRGGVPLGRPGPRTWQRSCSTPAAQTAQTAQSDDVYFTFTRAPQFTQPESGRPSRSPPLSQRQGLRSYNLNFSSVDPSSCLESELLYPALVVKRLSMGEGGSMLSSESRKETMAEVSLICEEDLLDTIFHACDTQRRGKVYVSRIVDYLRHTTSRGSEDSGLEELCNMLDPDHKDVSIDLDTYHAIMKEWIDDCRNNGEETAEDLTQDSVKLRDSLAAKRSVLLNMTSGSLEALGGEVSRADLETSDLVYCVADLQFSNQKLQEEVKKLKQSMENIEEANQKLVEENQGLHNQAKIGQQLAQKEKMLKEEVEEMKMTLSCTEEGRARASAQRKHTERENQSLIAKISSLQEENIKVTMEMDDLQMRMNELCDLNADLQVQNHSFDAVLCEKESVVLEKNRQIEELKAAVFEYCSITELLRADKNKLESLMHMMQPDLATAGLSLSAAYRLNQASSGCLQTELALAQHPLELCFRDVVSIPQSVDRGSSSQSFASPLDETLDREVLLLLQGPSQEHQSREFRSLLNKLQREFREEATSILSTVKTLLDKTGQPLNTCDPRLQTVLGELDARRADWTASLEHLDQYTDSLEKEIIKMASNMRRSRTEILHLSARVQEQENQKQQLREELDQLKSPQDSREASCQTPDIEQEPGEELYWEEEFVLQDFLRDEVEVKHLDHKTQDQPAEECRLMDRPADQGEEQSMLLETGGEGRKEELSGTSMPLSPQSRALPGQELEEHEQETTASPDRSPMVNSQPPQEAKLPGGSGLCDAHLQAVSDEQREADAPSHSTLNENAVMLDMSPPGDAVPDVAGSPDNGQTITTENSPPKTEEMVLPSSVSPLVDDTISPTVSSVHPPTDAIADRAGAEHFTASMSTKSLSQEQLSERLVAEESTSLLPVLEEEEEGVPESEQVPAFEVKMAGKNSPAVNRATTPADSSAPLTVVGSTVKSTDQTQGSPKAGTLDPSLSKDGLPAVTGGQGPSGAKKDSVSLRGKFKRELELTRSMGAIEEQKVREDLSESSVTTDKEAETSVMSEETNDSMREDRNSLTPNEKEIETEFQRLSLGFKCDTFTLEKRLRLEERSRDLAEENVRREVSSCQGLLQALTPLCEDDNQSMEIIQRLQKNLDILIQSMTRVSSRSEMLGSIHQESRTGKAVEVMIQHVENLRRMYTKEHAELTELRETMINSERSFGSHSDRGADSILFTDDFRGKKQSGSQYSKATPRRVSIAAIPRSSCGTPYFDMPKTQDITETDAERLTRRSPWNVAGKSATRPPLKRFVSSGAWVDTDEPSLMMKGVDTDSQSEEDRKEEPVVRKSSLTELGNKITALIMPNKTPTPSSSLVEQTAAPCLTQSHLRPASRVMTAPPPPSTSRGLWIWLAMVVVLAGLLALLASLMMQPAVDAAPVGTGDSWMTIQQLLWPYTGLRHHGQPPV
ncbi:inositol 1,4,5-triphosphate receptor associated 2 [Aplochiton taeniatus]